jgi:Ca-activated chloride channel family protein
MKRITLRIAVALALVFAFLATDHAEAKRKKKAEREAEAAAVAALPEAYQLWLKGVKVILSKDEKELFLALAKDYQRDAFIERFWKVRDPISRTARNEFREEYNQRLEIALRFGFDDRAEILLLNGLPVERFEIKCRPQFWPLEVWYYAGSDRTGSEFLLIFYQIGGLDSPFRLWEPVDGVDNLQSTPGNLGRDVPGGATSFRGGLESACGIKDAEILAAAIANLPATQGGVSGASLFMYKLTSKEEPPDKEWVSTFSTYTTEVPDGAETFPATVELNFPGRHQSRTVLQGAVLVDVEDITVEVLGPSRAYNLMMSGEILREGKLFENFRYKYDFPAKELAGVESVPLVFQRYLRAGEYQILLKIEDLASGRFFRYDEALVVPEVLAAAPPESDDPETARLLAEANAAIMSGESTISIVEPRGDWQTGLVRIDTLTTGKSISKVSFLLDGATILTKRRPPYNVEIDFGDVPRSRTLRVEAFDDTDNEVANDESLLNSGQHRFAVRLAEPRPGKTYKTSLRAQANVVVPDGELIERVEFYLNETLIATLYQPPYIQPMLLPDGGLIAYVRVVAYTQAGTSTEDVVFINAPDYLETVDVDFVELYTAVLDKQKRPVEALTRGDFAVLEDGVPQELVRFEKVANLPIHAAVMLDVSASMVEELAATQAAALAFFEQAVTEKDRAAIITFNDHPNLTTKFTNDVELLAGGLAGLNAERGTALYDSLIFALYYFNGIKGQRAILLLSDGKDESSRYKYDDALEYARRAGVAIYSIGLKLSKKEGDARRKLTKIAEETGGRSFFVEDEGELQGIYAAIQRELRSRYLLAYQSSNTSDSKHFRTIDVRVVGDDLEAITLRGYYP